MGVRGREVDDNGRVRHGGDGAVGDAAVVRVRARVRGRLGARVAGGGWVVVVVWVVGVRRRAELVLQFGVRVAGELAACLVGVHALWVHVVPEARFVGADCMLGGWLWCRAFEVVWVGRVVEKMLRLLVAPLEY